MITLPAGLENFMKGKNLDGLKPFALLFRNKWVPEESESTESGDAGGYYALETTPIDISEHIVKPNTLSMTLDVNEVAQYNANNVTLTLADTKNAFVEGTPNSYFPEGYQIYGSRVVLYYGTDGVNKTPLFTGVIKELPTYKPEQYQVELKLVSQLEMLKDIEAKDFSDNVTGETLTYIEDDDEGHKIYHTTGTGVGGFDAVYADGVKLFEGVDYETDEMNALSFPAVVKIIKSDYYSATITADYYTWKTGLTVEQIVAGLVGLAGYNSGTEDIRNVVWNTSIRSRYDISALAAIDYYRDGNAYKYFRKTFDDGLTIVRGIVLNDDCKIEFNFQNIYFSYCIGDEILVTGQEGYYPVNGIRITAEMTYAESVVVSLYQGGVVVQSDTLGSGIWSTLFNVKIEKNNNTYNVTITKGSESHSASYNVPQQIRKEQRIGYQGNVQFYGHKIQSFKNGELIGTVDKDREILFELIDMQAETTLDAIEATFSENSGYSLRYRWGNLPNDLSEWQAISFGAPSGVAARYFQYDLQMDQGVNISDVYATFLSSSLRVQLVNLSGITVLEALQDFALISGYEFGVDRQGTFFFKPRVSSTTPTYMLDHNDVEKVETVKKNLSDLFTKLTLTFAQVPLEFYANTGARPTPVDKYGVINKEISKPDIVNYDNPELAQAIGPQLLEVYSALPNIIQATGKLNLALELGDIVNLKRNYSLVEPESASDYTKYANQQTYYRACKITGMNYNFSKRQITYTLRDVSNTNNSLIEGAEMWEFVYDLPIQLGAK